jgi:hypothetical protein
MLAKKLRERTDNTHTLSGDALRHTLKELLPGKDYLAYDVEMEEQYLGFYAKHADHALRELKTQGRHMWGFTKRYIEAIKYESDASLIVDGIDLWPDLIKELTIPYKAIFLIDTSPDQWSRVIEQKDQYDWLSSRNLTQQQIVAWAHMSALRSEMLKNLCITNDFKYFDIAELGFSSAQESALKYLTNTLQ